MRRIRLACHHVAATDAVGRVTAATSVNGNDFDP